MKNMMANAIRGEGTARERLLRLKKGLAKEQPQGIVVFYPRPERQFQVFDV